MLWLVWAGGARAASVPRQAGEFVVKLSPSGETLLSSHRGKVVVLALLSTTCPHCQRFVPTLNQAQREYGPKGVQVIGAAFNPMANMYVPDFIKQFRPEFPFGWSPREPVHEFLQHSPMMQLYVPIVLGIDRQGTVRAQHTGDDPFFENEQGNLRAMIENLLKLPAGKASSGPAAKKQSGR
jgi:thiol-disulfide isomerase/thioredoxin